MMDSAKIYGMLLYVAQKVIESKPYLTEVDSAIGDGDHGIGMEAGFLAATAKLKEPGIGSTVSVLFVSVGKAMLMNMGGASGVIFGTLFISAGKAIAADAMECSEEDFARMFRSGLEGVKQRGKAQPGDKTMVDALEPGVVALENNISNGFNTMLAAARAAAWEGVEATKNMQAKFGRSKSLLERAIGFQDAGATSVAIIFQAMEEFLSEETKIK